MTEAMEGEQALPTLYQQVQHLNKYSRWIDAEKRRETWPETVDRYLDFLQEHLEENYQKLDQDTYELCRNEILTLGVTPSMRALMTAGPALKRDNVAAFNCAYLAMNRIHAFDEMLYILCCGCGVGYSVERQFVSQLPTVPDELYPSDTTIVVADSKIGWASALHELISLLYAGNVPNYDLSKVRQAGARLKTFGGRASGPEPLKALFDHVIRIFKNAVGRKLNSLEVHDICCKIGDIVVVGGVRRAALICLSNPSDDRMRNAKSGAWYDDPTREHFALANISAAWTEKPDAERFLEEWVALIKSRSGERGIFNREAAQKRVASLPTDRDPDHQFGLNPCGEIILRDREFCNLTQVTIRPEDTIKDLARKVKVATILGTAQSTFTNFRYLSKQWQRNCEEERLLGVGFTATQEHPVMSGRQGDQTLINWLTILREIVDETNVEWADRWGINPAKALRCMKPAGNSTELVGSDGSGLHDAYAPYYIRRFQINKTDAIGQVLYMQGFPCEDHITKGETTWVFSYPKKVPEGTVTRNDRSAIDRLKHWMIYAEHWTDHNPSATISVKDHEWVSVGAFVYENWDKMLGITFLPDTDHVYLQAPYEEITKDQYEELIKEVPTSIDWSVLPQLETEDGTTNVKDLACVSGACAI